MNDVKKIGVRLPNWLGDFVMSLGFLRALSEREPESKIYVIAAEMFRPVALLGGFDNFIPVGKPRWKSGFGLRRYKFDQYYVLPPSFSTAVEAFISGSRERTGYDTEGRGFLFTRKINSAGARSRHLVQEYLNMLDPGLKMEDWRPRLLPDSHFIFTDAAFRETSMKPYVVLAPGSAYGPTKKWPAEHYGKLAAMLKHEGFGVVVTGTPADEEEGREIMAACPGAVGLFRNGLRETVHVLAYSRGLVANDSGLSHVAAALSIPQLTIFGSSSPGWTAPLNPNGGFQYSGVECSPCFDRFCKFGHYKCLREITPEIVFKSFIALAHIN